ncbi:antibiotic biosynthesis monooxygenase family protein [Kitasatospora sp. NPDC098652]|uniref:antibiotic biosynthesis monooxygenase family protein n=1 Tax=Kitasatospora sp. NPDC098652 TaxID=3364095 RepID=UPI00380440A1
MWPVEGFSASVKLRPNASNWARTASYWESWALRTKSSRPVEGTDQYLVYTRWRSEEDFKAWMEGPMQAAHRGGGEGGEAPKRPAASGSTLWSFEVVQSAGPKA